MAKHRKKDAGYDVGARSTQWLSPQKPYTGNGHTRRRPHDPVRLDNDAGGKH